MAIQRPNKPFPEYKWRWAVYTPTESLNQPPVFLGVLRALRNCEGFRPNSQELIDALRIVQDQTDTDVNLIRQDTRNLIRNSGQYWKALHLLQSTREGIQLTEFGRKVADGEITALEFATTTIKTLELPNRLIESANDLQLWGTLRIRPLALILRILSKLEDEAGRIQAYITPSELRRIVIPLAGNNVPIENYSEAIIQYRNGILDISDWPDCAPESNDKRMAREFLLFLSNYDFCRAVTANIVDDERYYLNDIESSEIEEFQRIDTVGLTIDRAYERVRNSSLTAAVERRRVQRNVTSRPGQARFRNEVLAIYHSTCLVTGISIAAAIEAAHIIPVNDDGLDLINNSFCFRSDIHKLFDAGHIRINVDGNLYLSDTASQDNNYGSITRRIEIPEFVSRDNIAWRWNYY